MAQIDEDLEGACSGIQGLPTDWTNQGYDDGLQLS
jgi:hypothetical protein